MSSIALVRKQQKWVQFGWQGISLWIPEDWYPSALGSDSASGYLRVQNADGGAIEVKWSTPKGTVDMDAELSKYRKNLERAARKRREEFTWKDKPKVPTREASPGKNRHFFGWNGASQALGVIWYCKDCGRVVIAQVVLPRSEDATTLASRLLNGIDDHGVDDINLWSLYGLQVQLPTAWHLDRHQLMAGYTMLQFRKRDRTMRIERWALANIALKDNNLPEFIVGHSRKFWKEFSLRYNDCVWKEHPAARFVGRTRRVWKLLISPILRFIKLPAADRISVLSWHCEKDNKIFAVHSVHPLGDTAALEEIADTIVCA